MIEVPFKKMILSKTNCNSESMMMKHWIKQEKIKNKKTINYKPQFSSVLNKQDLEVLQYQFQTKQIQAVVKAWSYKGGKKTVCWYQERSIWFHNLQIQRPVQRVSYYPKDQKSIACNSPLRGDSHLLTARIMLWSE